LLPNNLHVSLKKIHKTFEIEQPFLFFMNSYMVIFGKNFLTAEYS